MTDAENPVSGGHPTDDGRPPFDPALDPPRADDVPDDHPVRVMLAGAADDPAAPASSVTVASVLAEARRAPAVDSDADIEQVTDIDPATGRPRYVPPVYARPLVAADAEAKTSGATPAPVPTPVWSGSAAAAPAAVPASVLAARQVRRRRRLAILAAAACVGVAAVAVPFALSRNGSSTPTAASAPAAATTAPRTQAAAGGPESGPAGASGAATSTLGAPGGGGALSQGSFAESGAATAPGAEGSPLAAPDGAAPSAAGSAVPESLRTQAGTGSCSWTPLPAGAATALSGALPGGSYGAPQPLTSGCRPDGVYGALVPSTQNQPPLTVTVSRAADGACTTGTPACVSAGQGQYIGSTADGQLIVYAYTSGWEAMIAPDAVDAGDPTLGAATVEELLQAAQAVADSSAAG